MGVDLDPEQLAQIKLMMEEHYQGNEEYEEEEYEEQEE
jgi:hypothetical protein